MRTHKISQESILLPPYVLETLKTLPWLESKEGNFEFYHDDFIVVLYGVRGSTAFSGPSTIRYGANTSCYQIWSPKLPVNHLYLGDGGSGVLEIDDVIIKQLFSKKINPFTATPQEVEPHIARVLNTYTHYHYDHLHLGAPLAGIFHANGIPKTIIGGDNPKSQFTKTFRRPAFPRDFGEIQASYSFHNVEDPRSAVLVFTPNGDFREMTSSEFQSYLGQPNPQIRHQKTFYNLEDCVVVRLYNADHPDPCISFRYENYTQNGKLTSSFVYMTDHEVRETDDKNSYFQKHIKGADVVYMDGQYTEKNFIPGFGHGRVEIIGQIAAKMELSNVLIGHHDPKRTDTQIDTMMALANQSYLQAQQEMGASQTPGCRLVGASDRMLVFIPSAERKRKGVVFGRMNVEKGSEHLQDAIGPQASVQGSYQTFDLTQVYKLDDLTQSV